MSDVQPHMDLLGAIVDRHIEMDELPFAGKVRRIYPVVDKCKCPECGADTELRRIEATEQYEPEVIVRMEPYTLTCTDCGTVTDVRA